MTLQGREPIGVTVAEFEDIVSLGLQSLIEEDASLRLIAANIPQSRLDAALSTEATDVAILNLGALENPLELRALHDRFPGTRLLVLADNPSAAQGRQLLGFGATACLAKSTDARDVLHAIYLASRGMHVLPAEDDSDEEYETAGPTPLTPRETDVSVCSRTAARTPRSPPPCTWAWRPSEPTPATSTASSGSARGVSSGLPGLGRAGGAARAPRRRAGAPPDQALGRKVPI